jgi:hypothetical protein
MAMVLAFKARNSTKDVDAIFDPSSDVRAAASTAEYMLAMKVLAARAGIGAERGDKEDIAFLIRLLGLGEASELMSIVARYYDPSRILPRSIYLVDEILEEMGS